MLDLNSSLRDICDQIWEKDDPDHVELKEKFFNTPSIHLHNKTPLEMMKSPRGCRELKRLLLQAIYGVYL
jgi:uncharacterized protein (DUF2384 family)